jgi:hypothetical protein
MKKFFFFLDKFGDLDHARNLISYFSKKYQVFVLQSTLNNTVSVNDYIFQKLNDKLIFFPKGFFFLYRFLYGIKCRIKFNLSDRVLYNILKLLTYFFEKKKISLISKLVDKNSSVIFVGNLDKKIMNLKKIVNFKTVYLLHSARTHKGFHNNNFENFLRKKYYVKNLDVYVANNYNHWKSGGLRNKPIFLANPRYIRKFKFFNKVKNQIKLLLIIDKVKQSYQGNLFYYVNKKKYKEVLDFLLNLNQKIIIKLHPSLNPNELEEFIDLKKYKKNIDFSQKKTEELIAQSETIIGFGSTSLMDAFIYEKKILIPAHCLKYKSLFYECAPNNVSYNFNDFMYKIKNLDNLHVSKFTSKQYEKILGKNKNNLFQDYKKIVC